MENNELASIDSDSDMDDSELSSVIRDQDNGVDTSDTSDDEMWYESSRVSPVSSDSSFNESDNEGEEAGGFFQLMNQHLEIFNHEADSFFRVSLRTLYETLMEFMEERGGPAPQHIIQSLPTSKVTLAQIASNTTCPICFGEYIQEENLINLPCNHSYHEDCITSWLKLKSTCPTCRLDLAKDANATSRIETNLEPVDLTQIESLLQSDDNQLNEESNDDGTSSLASATSSTDSAQERLRAFSSSSSSSSRLTHELLSSSSSLSSTTTRLDSGDTTHERRQHIFSRSSSPIIIDTSSSDDSSPFSSKVSIVESANRTLNNEPVSGELSNAIQQNKRQTTSLASSNVPAKRKSRETEIW